MVEYRVSAALPIRPTLSFLAVSISVLYVCVSVPALEIGSSVYKMGYYSATQRSETESFVEMWMDICHTERNQKEKTKYMLMHICGDLF